MKAKITHKSNITANGDFEIMLDVVENEVVIYPQVKMLCKAGDDLEAKIASRIKDIEDYRSALESLPNEIDIVQEVVEEV